MGGAFEITSALSKVSYMWKDNNIVNYNKKTSSLNLAIKLLIPYPNV